MGTRSRIARAEADGGFTSIYCHWDGYPECVGRTLQEHYTDPAKIDALLALGDISSLDVDIGSKHDFNGDHKGVVNAYGRYRGEVNTAAKRSVNATALRAACDGCGAEFLYVWKDGTWYVTGSNSVRFFGMGDDDGWAEGELLTDALSRKEAA